MNKQEKTVEPENRSVATAEDLRIHAVNFGKSEKTPSIIEGKINRILEKGQFKGVNQFESPSSGRLFFTIILKEGQPDTQVRVFRETQDDVLADKLNSLISQNGYRQIRQTVSRHSNNIFTSVFFKKK